VSWWKKGKKKSRGYLQEREEVNEEKNRVALPEGRFCGGRGERSALMRGGGTFREKNFGKWKPPGNGFAKKVRGKPMKGGGGGEKRPALAKGRPLE